MLFFVFMDELGQLIVGGTQEASRNGIFHNFTVKHVFSAHPKSFGVEGLICF